MKTLVAKVLITSAAVNGAIKKEESAIYTQPALVQVQSLEEVRDEIQNKRWYQYALETRGTNEDFLFEKIYVSSAIKTDIFMRYFIALIIIESRFKMDAKSHADAYGLGQITQVAMKEAAIECSLPTLKNMKDLFGPRTNAKYSSCYLKKLLRESDGDWTATLAAYNGGYRQLARLLKGEHLVPETANYIIKIQRIKEKIDSYIKKQE